MNLDAKLRLFWMGKKERTRAAVELYLELKGEVTQEEVAKDFNISSISMRKAIKQIKEDPDLRKHYIKPRVTSYLSRRSPPRVWVPRKLFPNKEWTE